VNELLALQSGSPDLAGMSVFGVLRYHSWRVSATQTSGGSHLGNLTRTSTILEERSKQEHGNGYTRSSSVSNLLKVPNWATPAACKCAPEQEYVALEEISAVKKRIIGRQIDPLST